LRLPFAWRGWVRRDGKRGACDYPGRAVAPHSRGANGHRTPIDMRCVCGRPAWSSFCSLCLRDDHPCYIRVSLSRLQVARRRSPVLQRGARSSVGRQSGRRGLEQQRRTGSIRSGTEVAGAASDHRPGGQGVLQRRTREHRTRA